MSRKTLFFLFAAALLAFAVYMPRYYFYPKPECRVENTALQGVVPGSPEYRDRVIALLSKSKPDDFRYFFKTFETTGSDTWLIVNLRNKTSCFDARLLVKQWDKLEGMKRTNGRSYPEELHDLNWTLSEHNGRPEVLYAGMREVID